MSGVLNEFQAARVRYSMADRLVYLSGPQMKDSTFKFDIHCEYSMEFSHSSLTVWAFFDLASKRCLILRNAPAWWSYNLPDPQYSCSLLHFWIEDDLPVLSVNMFDNAPKFVGMIGTQFKEQFAAILLDDVINSGD